MPPKSYSFFPQFLAPRKITKDLQDQILESFDLVQPFLSHWLSVSLVSFSVVSADFFALSASYLLQPENYVQICLAIFNLSVRASFVLHLFESNQLSGLLFELTAGSL